MLQISPSALNEIRRIQQNQAQPDIPVKLSINSGGCSGLFYELKLGHLPKEQNSFPPSDRYSLVKVEDIDIVIDQDFAEYISKLKIDYAEDLMGGGFRFHNSQAQNVCGCGISFEIKKPKV